MSSTDFATLDLIDPPAVVAKISRPAREPSQLVARGEPKVQSTKFPRIRFLKNDGSLLRDLHDTVGPQALALIPAVAFLSGVVWVIRHFLHS